jgi:hypothetical protein
MGADFDQIELGECSQLGLRERAPTFAQFRDHTGSFRKGVQGGKRWSSKSFRELVSLLLSLTIMKTGGQVNLILLWNEQKKDVIGNRKGLTRPLLLNNGRICGYQ